MPDYQDAEFTEAPPHDPVTGEVLDATPVLSQPSALAVRQRQELAVGAAQAIAMATKEKALMEARMAIARERPRIWPEVRSKLLQECKRPGFADAAIYSKPVGGQNIEGLTIRFAEACVRASGNLRTTTELVEDAPRQVTYRVTVMDLETGSSFDDEFTLAKTVERANGKDRVVLSERKNSYGKTTYVVQATEDELSNKKAAAVSKIIRNLVLRLMPGDIVDECRAQCEATLASKTAQNPAAERNKVLDAFQAFGVSPRQVAEYLGRDNVDVLSPVEVNRLRPLAMALKDGETTWPAIMEARPTGKPSAQQQPPQQAPASSSPPPAAAAAAPATPPDPPGEEDPVSAEMNTIRAGMKAAKSRPDLQPFLKRIEALPPEDRKKMEQEYKDVARGMK
jgi:hypothetical protein